MTHLKQAFGGAAIKVKCWRVSLAILNTTTTTRHNAGSHKKLLFIKSMTWTFHSKTQSEITHLNQAFGGTSIPGWKLSQVASTRFWGNSSLLSVHTGRLKSSECSHYSFAALACSLKLVAKSYVQLDVPESRMFATKDFSGQIEIFQTWVAALWCQVSSD